MRQIFKDSKLQKQLDEVGFVKIQYLSKTQVNRLKDFFYSTPHQALDQPFYSTMHINNFDYRWKVDNEIKAVVADRIRELFVDYRVLFTNFLLKKSGENSQVVIHQDWVYIQEEKYTSVNIWSPLVDVGMDKGPLYFLKASDKLKTPKRFMPFSELPYTDLFDLIKKFSIPVLLEAGEAVVYKSNLIHFSTPNVSGEDRLVINKVAIPIEAKPIHYYKPQDTNILDVYEVDERFYNETILGDPPAHGKLIGREPFDEQCFTEEDLLRLYNHHKSVSV